MQMEGGAVEGPLQIVLEVCGVGAAKSTGREHWHGVSPSGRIHAIECLSDRELLHIPDHGPAIYPLAVAVIRIDEAADAGHHVLVGVYPAAATRLEQALAFDDEVLRR